MPSSDSKKKYDIQYAKDKLKRIPLDVQKEKYEEIKAAASASGEPINGYIKKAIDERMERDATSTGTTDITPARPPEQPQKPKKHYQPFTESDAKRIDLDKLLKDIRYQLDVGTAFGDEVLKSLMEKARQQEAENSE